jgi:hypothetical protein
MNYDRSVRTGRGLSYRSHAERTVGIIKYCLAGFVATFEIPVLAQTCLQRDFISELSQPAGRLKKARCRPAQPRIGLGS